MDIQQKQIGSIEQRIVLHLLAESVQRDRCKFLEIGSWCGDSTVIFGKVAKKVGSHLFCIDWWKGNPNTELEKIASTRDIFSLFWNRICREGLEDVVIPIRGRSEVISRILKNRVFDLVFIDGDHRYENMLRDIKMYAPLVRKNGILCGHDCEGRIDDFEMSFLKLGKDRDYYEGVHCGVVLAVGSTFKNYSLDYGIWSVQATGQGSGWKPTGSITINQQRFEECIETLFSEPIDINTRTDISIFLGNVYSQQGKYKKAEEELKKALSLELPDRNTKANILIALGNIYLQQQRYSEAEEEYKETLALEPLCKNVKCNILIQLGNLYSQQQRYTEAEKELKKALSLEPPDGIIITSIHYALASLYEKKGDIEKAKEKFEEVVKLAKEVVFLANKNQFLGGALFHLGSIYQKRGEESKARHHFEECLKFISDHRKAKEKLSDLF